MSEVSGTIGAKGEKMKAEKDAKDAKDARAPKKKGAAAVAPSVGVALDRHFTKIGVDPLGIAVRVRDAPLLSSLETVDVMKPPSGG